MASRSTRPRERSWRSATRTFSASRTRGRPRRPCSRSAAWPARPSSRATGSSAAPRRSSRAKSPVVRPWPPAGLLALARAALGVQAPLLRRTARASGLALARDAERVRQARAQPLERQLAVARLRARVLGDRDDARPAARHHAALLLVRQRIGLGDVEHGLDARGGHVGVLAARP